MFKTRRSVSINRSSQDVFNYVTDPANDANWQGLTESSHWTSEGPPGVGSTQDSVSRFLGRKMESTLEITIWARPTPWDSKSPWDQCHSRGPSGLNLSARTKPS